jgi:DNA-binding GntR family transcriptional regulator
MNAIHSKSAFLYTQVLRALQSGDYAPGQRIDPATLARHFKTSATPVRFALYRLVGEGLIADHARNGLHVPLLNEVAMRDLYDWMQRLLLMACDIGPATNGRKNGKPDRAASDHPDDVVQMTWELFESIAASTAHRSLHHAVRQANDRLATIRHAKQALVDDSHDELAALRRHWQDRDIAALKPAIRGYHERRKQLVPRIVALLSDQHDARH